MKGKVYVNFFIQFNVKYNILNDILSSKICSLPTKADKKVLYVKNIDVFLFRFRVILLP